MLSHKKIGELMKFALVSVLERFALEDQREAPRATYFALMTLGLLAMTLTGYLGGFLSGVEAP